MTIGNLEQPNNEEQVKLTSDNAKDFLTRFNNCYDGVVRTVFVDFRQQAQKSNMNTVVKNVVVAISVMDSKSSNNNGWANLEINVKEVSQFKLIEGSTTSVVLSSGLSIGFFSDKIYLAFDAEVETLEEFSATDFLVVGQQVQYSVLPYLE